MKPQEKWIESWFSYKETIFIIEMKTYTSHNDNETNFKARKTQIIWLYCHDHYHDCLPFISGYCLNGACFVLVLSLSFVTNFSCHKVFLLIWKCWQDTIIRIKLHFYLLFMWEWKAFDVYFSTGNKTFYFPWDFKLESRVNEMK